MTPSPAGLEGVKHVILDRDGVLNREDPDLGYVVQPACFHWLPGALAGLALLRRSGVYISVTTNQSGVGRGLMSLAQLEAVHAHMRAQATANGGGIDAVLYCPHAPEEGCTGRKPAPGLIRSAVALAGIAAARCLVVGDDERDLEAARRAGLSAALVRTGKGRQTEARAPTVPAYDGLFELARAIVAGGVR